jgi:hypothetical protein
MLRKHDTEIRPSDTESNMDVSQWRRERAASECADVVDRRRERRGNTAGRDAGLACHFGEGVKLIAFGAKP